MTKCAFPRSSRGAAQPSGSGDPPVWFELLCAGRLLAVEAVAVGLEIVLGDLREEHRRHAEGNPGRYEFQRLRPVPRHPRPGVVDECERRAHGQRMIRRTTVVGIGVAVVRPGRRGAGAWRTTRAGPCEGSHGRGEGEVPGRGHGGARQGKEWAARERVWEARCSKSSAIIRQKASATDRYGPQSLRTDRRFCASSAHRASTLRINSRTLQQDFIPDTLT